MMNMMQAAREQAKAVILRSCEKAAANGTLPGSIWPEPSVEVSADPSRGDLTSAFCLAAAGVLSLSPRRLADGLLGHIDLNGTCFTAVEAAGPGYLNFHLGDKWYADTLVAVEQEGDRYGSSGELSGQTVRIQLTADASRGSALRRDALHPALTNLLSLCGAEVTCGNTFQNYVNHVTIPVAACQLACGGQPIDKALPLSDLPTDTVGFLLGTRPDRAVTVDLEQAAREDRSNPFYCARYIYRRMSVLLQRAERQGISVPRAAEADLSAFQSETVRLLIRILAQYPDTVISAAHALNPGVMVAYLARLSDAMWTLYRERRSGEISPALLPARLVLTGAARTVMENVLHLLCIRY